MHAETPIILEMVAVSAVAQFELRIPYCLMRSRTIDNPGFRAIYFQIATRVLGSNKRTESAENAPTILKNLWEL